MSAPYPLCPIPPLLPVPTTGLTAELLLLNSFNSTTITFLTSKLLFPKQLNFQNNFQIFKKIFKINFINCCVHDDDDENFISIYNSYGFRGEFSGFTYDYSVLFMKMSIYLRIIRVLLMKIGILLGYNI